MMMIDVRELARWSIDCLATNPSQKEIEIGTASLSNEQVRGLIDAVFEEGTAAGVTVKGVIVDPMQIPLPDDAEFLNAFRRKGRLIVVDIDVDDKVIVRRAKPEAITGL